MQHRRLLRYIVLLLILATISPTLTAGVLCILVLRRLWELEKNGRI